MTEYSISIWMVLQLVCGISLTWFVVKLFEHRMSVKNLVMHTPSYLTLPRLDEIG
jgi:hypothetical protein